MTTPKSYIDELAAGVQRLREKFGYMNWATSFEDGVIVIIQMQLALRHPGNRGHASQRARHMVDCWINAIGETEPRVAELLRLGDDPSHDVTQPCAKG